MNRMLALVVFLALLPALTPAQVIESPDPEIARMVGEVSADTLRATIGHLVGFGTRHTLSGSPDGRHGIVAARAWVLARFREWANESGGRFSASIDSSTVMPDGQRINRPVVVASVVGTLKGADPDDDRVYVVSGHLDSRATGAMDSVSEAPGADDDGSGTAAVMECARVMCTHAFAATVKFTVVSGEEQGLFGSTHIAGEAKAQHWNVDAVLNNDIMGGSASAESGVRDNTRVRVFSEGLPAADPEKSAKMIRMLGLENDGKARQLARYVKEMCARYIPHLEAVMIYRNDRFLRGGDHTPWVENGYAAVRITEMNEDYRHQHQNVRSENGVQYGDLPEFIDFDYLRKNAALNLATLASLAKAPPPPRDVSVEVRALTNATELSWTAPRTGKPKGYYVLMRETTSPVWQTKLFTTATEIRLPWSKDNYFFAVQSVGEQGDEGLPVVPAVRR